MIGIPSYELDAPALSRIAAGLYTTGPFLLRRMLQLRSYICPFERLLAHVPNHASVLDVGCGGGLFLGFLAVAGKCVRGTGFDCSRPAIACARDMADRVHGQQRGSHLSFELIESGGLWPDAQYDVVSVIDVMHHVPPSQQRSFFDLAANHTAPGGLLLYKDMCRSPWWRAQANRLHDLLLARQWIHYVRVATLEHWAMENGLVLEHAESISRYWYGHELRLFRRTLK